MSQQLYLMHFTLLPLNNFIRVFVNMLKSNCLKQSPYKPPLRTNIGSVE